MPKKLNLEWITTAHILQLVGTLELYFPIDDNVTMTIDVFGKQRLNDSGTFSFIYRSIIPTLVMRNFCTMLMNDTFYKGVSEVSNFPSPSNDLCPIPVEHYTVTNYRLELPENYLKSISNSVTPRVTQARYILNFYKNEIHIFTAVFR